MSTIRAKHKLRRNLWHKARTIAQAVTILIIGVAVFAVLSVATFVTGLGVMLGTAGLLSGLL